MDPSHIRNELALSLPGAEASELANRIMSAVRAPATLGIYTPIIQKYEEFRGSSTIPHSSSVFAFLAKNYFGKASFRTAAAALRLHFVAKGISPNPLDSDAMAILRPAAEREKTKPVHREKWITTDVMETARYLETTGTPPNKRLRALILVNFAAFMRPSEGVAIQTEDISFKGSQMLIRIPKTKTNQNGPSEQAIVDELANSDCCPVKAAKDWMAHPARKNSKWLFPNLKDVTQHVKLDRAQGEIRRLRVLGVIPEGLSLHGLRGGATTACIEAGIPIDAVQRAGRWSNPKSMKPYIGRTTHTLQGTTNAMAAGLQHAQEAATESPDATENQE